MRPCSASRLTETKNYAYSQTIDQDFGATNVNSIDGKSHITKTSPFFYDEFESFKPHQVRSEYNQQWVNSTSNFKLNKKKANQKPHYKGPVIVNYVDGATKSEQGHQSFPKKYVQTNMINRPDYMRSQIENMIHIALSEKQNNGKSISYEKINKLQSQNQGLVRILKTIQQSNHELKYNLLLEKEKSGQIIKDYQNKLYVNQLEMEKLNNSHSQKEKQLKANYVPKATVQQLIKVYEMLQGEQEKTKNSYSTLTQQYEQFKKTVQEKQGIAEQNIRQLHEDIFKLKLQLENTEMSLKNMEAAKNKLEMLYNEKKKDFQALKQMQQQNKNSHKIGQNQLLVEKRKLTELQKMAQIRETKITQLRQANFKLQERIKQLHEKGPQVMQTDQIINQLKQENLQLKSKLMDQQSQSSYEQQKQKRLELQGKLSLICIQNQRLRQQLHSKSTITTKTHQINNFDATSQINHIKQLENIIQKLQQEDEYVREYLRSTLLEIQALNGQFAHQHEIDKQRLSNIVEKINTDISKALKILEGQ